MLLGRLVRPGALAAAGEMGEMSGFIAKRRVPEHPLNCFYGLGVAFLYANRRQSSCFFIFR